MEQVYGSEPVDVVAGTVEATLRLMRVVFDKVGFGGGYVSSCSPLKRPLCSR